MSVYRYEHQFEGHLYFIDIVSNPDSFDAWISREDISVSSLMFGLSKRFYNFPDFLLVVESNLAFYIDEYLKKYVQEEYEEEGDDNFFEMMCQEFESEKRDLLDLDEEDSIIV